ncbi:dihydroorotase [Lachnospira multipara]|uniref:dihydroorotase n=1 Tax=Lachnospira multipara TaxID=28051 RepID=UPI000486689C|nr:dihydroorotase [Lachnospira multipara]
MKILIKNGRVIDPANKIDDQIDILVDKNVISKVTNNISEAEASGEDDLIIDANGCYVCPGLIDLRVHFREPGFEHKETIRTGARAAARGGFTTVCTMPKTKPAIDSEERVREAIEKAKDVTDINVLPVGAITASDEGQYLTDFDGMKRAGAVAVCEDGNSIMDARVARQALKQAAEVDIPVFAHCEDRNLMARGVMNAGDRAKELGLYGILDAVEETMVARDILLAKDTKAKLHICHVSTKTAVDLIKQAKDAGLDITAEVTPQHLILTEMDVDGSDANYKIAPPLRKKEDRDALIKGLRLGIIDAIATDHSPHHYSEKAEGFVDAPFGMSMLESAVSLVITELVAKNLLTPMQMVDRMSLRPSKIIGIDRGTLGVGKVADITIIDPKQKYVIDSSLFASKGKNTPFNGKEVKGKVIYTIVNGRIVYSNKDGNEFIIDKDETRLE